MSISRAWTWAIVSCALSGSCWAQQGQAQPKLVIQAGHVGEVSGLAFSPDDKLLASGGADRTVKIWDVASMRELRTATGHQEAITARAVAGDGTAVASADRAGEVLVHDVA